MKDLLIPICILLLCLPGLSAIGQRISSYEYGEAFAIQMTGKQMTTQRLLGAAGKVFYNSPAKTYLVAWSQKDGIIQTMRFRPIGKFGDLAIYEEQKGNSYVIDNQN